jgi:ribosomal protein S12 methylthiotransferase accessory factor YcaO
VSFPVRAHSRINTAWKRNFFLSERTVAPAETLARAIRIAADMGVTRLADITGLDRVGIPVFSAIVPRSGYRLSVCNGKGLTTTDARTGALMEAIERQTAVCAELPLVEASYHNLREAETAVVDPQSFNHKLRDDYSEDRPYCWVEGFDLVAGEPLFVPAGLAGFGSCYTRRGSPYEVNSSNGLASGNCFSEAVCHALCELVERDAWTFAELRSQWIPLARRKAAFGREIAEAGWDDPNSCPRIDLRNAGEPFGELMQKFESAGLCPVVRDTTSQIGIPSAIAAVADDSVLGFPQAHGGMGAHPNARIAVMRALTELAQSRAVDIQGVREDIRPAGIEVRGADARTQRVQKIQTQRWTLQQNGLERPFRDIPSVENEDIADDIRLILSRLTRNGIERVIVVDLSEPGGFFSVIRVLVPGLEFWALDQGKLGPRATQFWREHV